MLFFFGEGIDILKVHIMFRYLNSFLSYAVSCDSQQVNRINRNRLILEIRKVRHRKDKKNCPHQMVYKRWVQDMKLSDAKTWLLLIRSQWR